MITLTEKRPWPSKLDVWRGTTSAFKKKKIERNVTFGKPQIIKHPWGAIKPGNRPYKKKNCGTVTILLD